MVNINKYIKALLHPAGGHQGSHKAHQAGNQSKTRIGFPHAVQQKSHDDVIKWKLLPRYWPFVRGIYRSPVNSPHKGQWLGALMFSLICARINGQVNNREAGNLRRHRAHYDVIVMMHIARPLLIFFWLFPTYSTHILQGYFTSTGEILWLP